jgi:hypothetical protein
MLQVATARIVNQTVRQSLSKAKQSLARALIVRVLVKGFTFEIEACCGEGSLIRVPALSISCALCPNSL